MCACVKPATHIYKEVHFENKGRFALGIAIAHHQLSHSFEGSQSKETTRSKRF